MDTKFRYIGITDESIVCDKCGKQDLRSTVILGILDADGNVEETVYYGSTCAARALSVKGGGKAVLSSARAAHDRTLANARDARKTLEFYGLPVEGAPERSALMEAGWKFREAHSGARWFGEKTAQDWHDMVMDMLSRRQTQIKEAALLGHK